MKKIVLSGRHTETKQQSIKKLLNLINTEVYEMAIKQIVFSGKQAEVLALIKNMAEFETLGKFFEFQNEMLEVQNAK